MRVGLICPADFTVLLCCKWIIKHLQDQGNEVIVISPLSKDNFYLEEISKFNVIHLKVKMNRHINIIDDILYIFQLFKIFKKYRIKSIFSVCTKPNIYSPIAGKLAGIDKIYISVWGRGTAFLDSKKLKNRIVKQVLLFLYKISFKISNIVWFTNPNDLKYFTSKKLLNKQKTLLTYNYIDSDIYKPKKLKAQKFRKLRKEFNIKDNNIVIILVGRMIWSKGIKEYVEAGKILYKTYPSIKLLLIGAEEKNNPDSIPSKYLNNLSKYKFITWTNFRNDVPDLYSLAKIAVLPSYYKEGGYPRAITEPMAMGIPVIAADTPDCSGAIENMKNGILVLPKNSKDLANKIKLLIENDNLYRKLSSEGRKTILKKFDEKKVIKDVVRNLYYFKK